MWNRMLAEAVVIAVQTVVLIGLCATIGVSGSDRKAVAGSVRPLGLIFANRSSRTIPPHQPISRTTGDCSSKDCSRATGRLPALTAASPRRPGPSN